MTQRAANSRSDSSSVVEAEQFDAQDGGRGLDHRALDRLRTVMAHRDSPERAEAQDVRLRRQPARVVFSVEEIGSRPFERSTGGLGIECGVDHPRELRDVSRSARLRSPADRRALPTAEGLAPHDRPGDVPVDVGVANLDARQPLLDLGRVERVDPTGEAERTCRSAAQIAWSRSRARMSPRTGPKHSV